MKKLLVGLCVVATLSGVSGVACAVDEAFYAGAGIGQSHSTMSYTSTGTSATYTDTAFNAFAGYLINKNLAIEAEYIDLGKFQGPTASVAGKGFKVSALDIVPITDRLSLYGKVGAASVSTSLSANVGHALLVPATQSKIGASFGLGVQLKVSPTAAIRLGVDSYEYASSDNVVTSRVAVYGVSGIFKF